MSTSLSLSNCWASQDGSLAHLGQLLESYGITRIAGSRGDWTEPAGETRCVGPCAGQLLEAHRNFSRFQGAQETQFVCWLRQIMAASLANLLRRYLGPEPDFAWNGNWRFSSISRRGSWTAA